MRELLCSWPIVLKVAALAGGWILLLGLSTLNKEKCDE